MIPSLQERFDALYIPEPMSGCWLWIGTAEHDYGQLSIAGRSQRAHRVSWELHNGRPVPDGLHVLHKCDVPCCVNPDHLYVGTNADNTRDRVTRNRDHRWGGARRGDGNPRARLSAEDVLEIVGLLGIGVKCMTIGEIYGVSESTIGSIKRGERWQHLTGIQAP